MRTNMFKRALAMCLLAALLCGFMSLTASATELPTPEDIPMPGASWASEGGGTIVVKLVGETSDPKPKLEVYKLIEVNAIDVPDTNPVVHQPGDPAYRWTTPELKAWVDKYYPDYSAGDTAPSDLSVRAAIEKLKGEEKAAEAAEFFTRLEKAIEKNDPEKQITDIAPVDAEVKVERISDGCYATISGLNMGAYLIVVKDHDSVYQPTVVLLTPFEKTVDGKLAWYVQNNTRKNMKGTPVSLKKEITAPGSGTATSAGIGDKVSYKITGVIPAYVDEMLYWDYTVSDEMAGMKLIPESLRVMVDDEVIVEYDTEEETLFIAEKTVTVDGTSEVCAPVVKVNDALLTDVMADPSSLGGNAAKSFSIDLNGKANYHAFLKGCEKITVTYDAVILPDAVMEDPNVNTAHLAFSSNPYASAVPKVLDDSNDVFVYGLDLIKIKKADREPLKDAEFKLYDSSNKEIHFTLGSDGIYHRNDDGEDVLTSGEDGSLILIGLAAGTYNLVETKAPSPDLVMKNVSITIRPRYVDGKMTGAVDVEESEETDAFGPKPEEPLVPGPLGPVPEEPGPDATAAEKKEYELKLAEYEALKKDIEEYPEKLEKYNKEMERYNARKAVTEKGFYPRYIENAPPERVGYSTGGLGTAPFSILGILLMAGGALIVTTAVRKRHSRA